MSNSSNTCSSPSVCVVIPCRNRVETTLRCIANIHKTCQYHPLRVLIVDDGSVDGTGARVSESFPDTIVLQGDGNLWWGGAVRAGTIHAVAAGHEHIVLLNDDCRPTPEAWRVLIENSIRDTGAVFLADIQSEHSIPVRLNSTMVLNSSSKGGGLDELNNATGQFVIFSAASVRSYGLPGTTLCPHYYDGVLFPSWKRKGARIYRVNGANAVCEWEALRALEPYDRLLISSMGFYTYMRFCLTHQKSRYRIATRVAQMYARHGRVKGPLLALVRYGIFTLQSLRAWLLRAAGRGETEFRNRVALLPDHALRNAVLSEMKQGASVTFS